MPRVASLSCQGFASLSCQGVAYLSCKVLCFLLFQGFVFFFPSACVFFCKGFFLEEVVFFLGKGLCFCLLQGVVMFLTTCCVFLGVAFFARICVFCGRLLCNNLFLFGLGFLYSLFDSVFLHVFCNLFLHWVWIFFGLQSFFWTMGSFDFFACFFFLKCF